MADLITWKGKPVPWVTRWTNECPDREDTVMHVEEGPEPGTVQLAYNSDVAVEEREANGILWQREGISRGGEPQFSQVSTYRQRASMRKRLCQVCGERITTPVISWLMAPGQFDVSPEGHAITTNPPTCDDCVKIALEKCPHLLKAGHFVVKVLEYELWGVQGEGVLYDPKAHAIMRQNQIRVPYLGELQPMLSRSAVVAKQQVVRFTKFKVDD
jgi:hypothetical protein